MRRWSVRLQLIIMLRTKSPRSWARPTRYLVYISKSDTPLHFRTHTIMRLLYCTVTSRESSGQERGCRRDFRLRRGGNWFDYSRTPVYVKRRNCLKCSTSKLSLHVLWFCSKHIYIYISFFLLVSNTTIVSTLYYYTIILLYCIVLSCDSIIP